MCGTGCCNDGCDRNMRFVSKLCVNELKSNKLVPRFCGSTLEIYSAQVSVKNVTTAKLPDPTKTPNGTLLYDSTTDQLKVVAAGAWVVLN